MGWRPCAGRWWSLLAGEPRIFLGFLGSLQRGIAFRVECGSGEILLRMGTDDTDYTDGEGIFD